ncbi:MAG: CbiX/SirB N-terminal domain-containing protein [Sterolibacteriaceae bacterium]|uniref:sirohydrochlorin chelatase n=1 Tax=Sulfuritalea sp. TaxID=2480090 RepID=UPI001A3A8C87|nr:CbiX/SirB N-terminal domain-containing protein [Sulfuritalea sp.]MBL8480163.1 CbiX/SirB N-terminal domain-containing protein [Sterolibacteriaceae bacterium]MBN8475012.1 CbiX/SirB N-terminal domain-containing protein [Sulfuritalea sp.]
MKGILLYGHGARNPEWAQPFHRIRDAIKARAPGALVEPGFLELMRPTFDEGVACLVDQGATSITVVPIFMAAGSHVKKDLPRLAADAMDRHEGLLIELVAPVGEADSVLAAMAEYAMGAKPAD